MSERCDAVIYKRDTYRRTGRGRSGFELHYRRERCSRRAIDGAFCRQHTTTIHKPTRWSQLYRITAEPLEAQ